MCQRCCRSLSSSSSSSPPPPPPSPPLPPLSLVDSNCVCRFRSSLLRTRVSRIAHRPYVRDFASFAPIALSFSAVENRQSEKRAARRRTNRVTRYGSTAGDVLRRRRGRSPEKIALLSLDENEGTRASISTNVAAVSRCDSAGNNNNTRTERTTMVAKTREVTEVSE